MKPKRYWIFAISHSEAIGGMFEFHSYHDTLEEAIAKARNITWTDLIHIFDSVDFRAVWSDLPDHDNDINDHIVERVS